MAFCAYCGTQVGETSYRPCGACGNPVNGAPRAQLGTGGKNSAAIAIAVVAIGLFAVVIGGIVAAIAIPNFLTALQRAKQKRTMADMRTLAVRVEGQKSGERYPSSFSTMKDGWNHDMRYACWPAGECTNYALVSAGKDGRFETENVENYRGGATTDFDNDIVFANGEFFQAPQIPSGGARE